MFDFLVIGKGLMGSAALRYLSQSGANVAMIGPDEPADPARHEGVFASHYDEGRLAAHLGKDLTWAWLSHRAIQQYAQIEAASGIRFHFPCGALRVTRVDSEKAYLANRNAIIETFNLPVERYPTPQAITAAHSMFAFPTGYHGLFEPAPAGYINPRSLIRAQLACAEQQGVTVIRAVVVAVKPEGESVAVTTDNGATYHARRVLIANGSFANAFDILARKVALRIKSETTILAQVSEAEAARLAAMPTVGYEVQSAKIDGIYMAPPVCYPDGHYYIKLGCDTVADQVLPDLAAIQQWMRTGDSDVVAQDIFAALHSIMPGLASSAYHTKRCLVTYTAHRKPYIDQLSDQLFIATGGNGSSGHNADTHGFLAAQLMLEQAWPEPFAREEFRVVYEDEFQVWDRTQGFIRLE